ncbi:hypothetical protein ABK046_42550 [Streptomyces caeruleatus]
MDGTAREDEDYRLVTTLLDGRRYPARQLAALYQERCEAEAVFAELKTHQRGAPVVLISKTPDRVLQQIWAHPHLRRASVCRERSLACWPSSLPQRADLSDKFGHPPAVRHVIRRLLMITSRFTVPTT